MKLREFGKIFAVTLLICSMLTGCNDAVEIDDEIYALAIGIDKGHSSNIKITVQCPTYKGGGKQPSASGAGDKESGEVDGTIVASIEAQSLLEGINLLNTSIGRRVSLMQSKMIVFSEEMARQGVSRYIAPITKFREARRIMRVVVSKTEAEEFIRNQKSLIGESVPKGIELFFEQSKNNGFFPNVTLHEFYKDLTMSYEEPYAIYAGVNDLKGTGKTEDDKSTGMPKSPVYTAGNMIRKGGPKDEFIGMAVFDGDKMTGILDGHETRFFLMIAGEFQRGSFTLSDIQNKNEAIVYDVRPGRRPHVNVGFVNGKPAINIDVELEADIGSIQSRIPYESSGTIGQLEQNLADYVRKGILQTVQKTQKEFNSDIFGFGRKAAYYFSTIQEWENYKWLDHYKDASVNVAVEVNIRRTGLTFESSSIK